jgi:hypothetical protein
MVHALAGFGSALSLISPSSWFLTGTAFAVSGALIGTVAFWRCR